MPIIYFVVLFLSCVSASGYEATDCSNIVPANCSVLGVELGHMQVKYLSGQPNVERSIYARCDNGNVTCYEDNALQDAQDKKTTCSAATVEQSKRRLGMYNDGVERLWPLGVLCYHPLTNLKESERKHFLEGAKEFEKRTSNRVMSLDECRQQRNDRSICGGCQHGIQVVREDECYSYIGYRREVYQKLSLSPKCLKDSRTTVHEVGHAFGLFHEHTHPKRTIVILRRGANVPPENYIINHAARFTAYDVESIMHYKLSDDMCIPKPEFRNIRFCDIDEGEAAGCVIPIADVHCDRDSRLEKIIGHADTLSNGDVDSIINLYGGTGIYLSGTSAISPNILGVLSFLCVFVHITFTI